MRLLIRIPETRSAVRQVTAQPLRDQFGSDGLYGRVRNVIAIVTNEIL